MENHGIERTEFVKKVGNIEVRSCVGIALVVPFYDSGIGRSCYGNGGANQKVFGFYVGGYGFWFKKKSDAIFGAQWVSDNDWDLMGDLEWILQGEMCTKENGWKDLGKVYF